MERESIYNKNNPFHAKVLHRESLSSSNSGKETHHLELCLAGSDIRYEVGDCIAILPSHDADLVNKILQLLNLSGEEKISYRDNGPTTAYNLLSNQVDIRSPTRKLLELIAEKNLDQASFLKELFNDKEALKSFLSSHDLYEVLEQLRPKGLDFQELCATLSPLLPRFYSIASSQKAIGESVHLTVGMIAYEHKGEIKHGICSHFLGCQKKEKIPIYLHPHRGFTLPQDPSAPVIMVGPGTGVAPFRGFMQERVASGAPGKNWLFFGERNETNNFLYRDFWQDLEQKGSLRLSTAFSRDQEHKIYVQHRMLHEAETLFSWLEEGAYFYVCGDATKMAKDVEAALLKIIESEGKMTPEEARGYLKRLRSEKRYLRDVY